MIVRYSLSNIISVTIPDGHMNNVFADLFKTTALAQGCIIISSCAGLSYCTALEKHGAQLTLYDELQIHALASLRDRPIPKKA
jgi:hypothetical protein